MTILVLTASGLGITVNHDGQLFRCDLQDVFIMAGRSIPLRQHNTRVDDQVRPKSVRPGLSWTILDSLKVTFNIPHIHCFSRACGNPLNVFLFSWLRLAISKQINTEEDLVHVSQNVTDVTVT